MKLNNLKINRSSFSNMLRRCALPAAMALACVAAYAEDLPIRATIPFAFTIGTKAMPAGDYVMREITAGVVTMKHEGESASVIALALPASGAEKSTLTFAVVDETKVLTMVRTQHWSVAFAAPASFHSPVAKGLEVPGIAAAAVLRKP